MTHGKQKNRKVWVFGGMLSAILRRVRKSSKEGTIDQRLNIEKGPTVLRFEHSKWISKV